MRKDQILVGSVFAVVCLIVAWKARWLAEHSKIGRGLANRLGEAKAVWALRAAFVAFAAFGVLLATGVVSPVRW